MPCPWRRASPPSKSNSRKDTASTSRPRPASRGQFADPVSAAAGADPPLLAVFAEAEAIEYQKHDPAGAAAAYRRIKSLVLTIDGLQPEKGHETLYTVREVNAKRVWFAESLLSSSTTEVYRLLVRARGIADYLGKPVRMWMSTCWTTTRRP